MTVLDLMSSQAGLVSPQGVLPLRAAVGVGDVKGQGHVDSIKPRKAAGVWPKWIVVTGPEPATYFHAST